jgi:glycosyltransferase involved in cell wall biosynthesis
VLIIVQNLSVPFDRRVWLESLALVAEGHTVDVICPNDRDEARFEVLDGVRIHRYRPPPPTTTTFDFLVEFAYCWVRTAALAGWLALRHGVDVVQACNPPDTYFPIGAAARLLGGRFVFDHHDLCPELFRSRFGDADRWALRALLWLERMTFRTADKVIATNQSYRSIALSRGGRADEDVTVVRSGPDLDRLRRTPPNAQLRAGRELLCCYLGVMGPQDGVDLAIEAIRKVVFDHGRSDCQFTFLGAGDCFEELRRLAADAGLDPWVTFTGRVPDGVVFDHLSTADVALCPDPNNPLNDLSTMNKTMEYMAFGVPVVAFDLTETRVTAGEAAVYAPPNDVDAFAKELHALLSDASRRRAMGAVGRERVEEELAWSHQRQAYVDLYRSLARLPDTPTGG